MPAYDLSSISQLPFAGSTATPGTSGLVRLVNLPTSGQFVVTVHNRDKATKDLRISFDQTLTDGGAAPSTYFTVNDPLTFRVVASTKNGFARITKFGFFSTASTAVNAEVLISEDGGI